MEGQARPNSRGPGTDVFEADLFEAAGAPRRCSVLLPLPLAGAYDYALPEGLNVKRGDLVRAPLGARMLVGVVWGAPHAEPIAPKLAAKLKPLEERIEAPPLGPDALDFVDWVAAYTTFPPGAVLRMVIRSGRIASAPKPKTGFARAQTPPEDLKMTPARARALEAANGPPRPARDIASEAGVSDAVIRGLADKGALKAVELPADAPFQPPDPALPGAALSADQEAAAEEMRAAVAKGGYAALLLDGVTGSGKTEAYFEAVAAALAADETAQVLVMLPEIALTMDFMRRVEARFGAAPALWHSDVGDRARGRVWRETAKGRARLIAGARSALFLPYQNLRLIIVDEEHDAAYKQEDGVIYQARDMAVARAARGGFPIVLASATPSLESYANARSGRYAHIRLTSRFGPARMPETRAIDMRKDGPAAGEWLAPRFVAALAETLAAGRQSMVFLNRRGYAPLTICRRCGHRMTAPDSDTWLVEHRFENRLVCHHTGYSIPKPKLCPSCGAENTLAPCGPGVERIAEELRVRFPEARLAVFSSDTVASPAEAQGLLRSMTRGEIDILVGTQVVAKGHNFPNLTFVGVADADLGLQGGDLRAAERTFQLLSQVAGRAGRASAPGRALLQTYQPEHPVMRALLAGDRDAFLDQEAASRRAARFPPFGRLAAVILSGPDEEAVRAAAGALARTAPRGAGADIWGPAPAPIARLRGRYRMRFLVRCDRGVPLQTLLRDWLAAAPSSSAVRRVVDVDPYSFL
ncbi:MAG: primosomal protein N' [Pseudomonadota bacterium]